MKTQHRTSDGDIELLYVAAEDHELRLVLRPNPSGVYFYKLLGTIALFEERDLPPPTEEEHSRIHAYYGINNEAPLTALTWEDALQMMNRLNEIRWWLMSPIYIHPSIAERIHKEIFDDATRFLVVDQIRWKECIARSAQRPENYERGYC